MGRREEEGERKGVLYIKKYRRAIWEGGKGGPLYKSVELCGKEGGPALMFVCGYAACASFMTSL